MNNEQWGNIELPGLSDEELLNKNWNKITGAREAVKAREKNGWKEKNEQRFEDSEYSKRVAKSISETYSTEEGRRKQSVKSKPHKEEAKEKIRKANIGKQRKGQSWIKSMAEKKKGNTCRCKPIVTPIGVFISLKEAEGPTKISIGRLRRYTKQLPWSKDYYHITKEEYIMLTGREL